MSKDRQTKNGDNDHRVPKIAKAPGAQSYNPHTFDDLILKQITEVLEVQEKQRRQALNSLDALEKKYKNYM